MKIIVDENIPGIEATFDQHGEVITVDGRQFRREQIKDAEALIIRSVTRVNRSLLEGTTVRFVGTATIGTDHIDTAWLEQAGIHWAAAPGCNADAAAEYSLAMIMLAQTRLDRDLRSTAIGVVGMGNVGSRLLELLKTAGATDIRVCDPPLTEAGRPGLCAMDEIRKCDLISFHVPYSNSGDHPTHHLVDQRFLATLVPGALLVNTSRGDIVDGSALLRWLQADAGHAALDVWPGEPQLDPELLQATLVSSPHVAGYSQDGKLRGTEMIYRAFCEWLNLDYRPPDLVKNLPCKTLQAKPVNTLADAVLHACPVEHDHEALQRIAGRPRGDLPAAFDALRRSYPGRRDFGGWVLAGNRDSDLSQTLLKLGFH